jgi:hypothetical protein
LVPRQQPDELYGVAIRQYFAQRRFLARTSEILAQRRAVGFREKTIALKHTFSPITFEQMTMLLREIGFDPVESSAVGSFSTPLMSLLTLPLWATASLLGGAPRLGECAIFVAP